MPASDPVTERIRAYSWPRDQVQARRIRGGYTLISTRTGEPVARLRPMPSGDGRFEVLLWRREAWGRAGPFGAVLVLDDALGFIVSGPASWIHA